MHGNVAYQHGWDSFWYLSEHASLSPSCPFNCVQTHWIRRVLTHLPWQQWCTVHWLLSWQWWCVLSLPAPVKKGLWNPGVACASLLLESLPQIFLCSSSLYLPQAWSYTPLLFQMNRSGACWEARTLHSQHALLLLAQNRSGTAEEGSVLSSG